MSSRLKLNSLHPRHPRSASSKASIRKSRVRKLGRQLGCTCGKRKAGLYYEVRKPANKCWKPSNRSLKFLAANPPPSQAPAAPTRTPPVCPKPGPTPPDRLITAPRSRNPFILFFLSLCHKNPGKRMATIAREAGKQWCNMSPNEKLVYRQMAKQAQKMHRERLQKHSRCSRRVTWASHGR
jgi:hypothetical protein